MKKPKVSENPCLKRAFNLSGKEDCKKLYEDWAETYDSTMVDSLNYAAPQGIAEQLAEHLTDRKAQILDLGCGTGLVGAALKEVGFENIDGIDFSNEMLAQSKQRRVYRSLIQADLTQTVPIESDTYEAAISAGIFTYGHLDATCVDEVLRLIRPEGLFSSAIRLQIWHDMGFEEKFRTLESQGRIQKVTEAKMPNYKGSDEKDGVYVTFRKLG